MLVVRSRFESDERGIVYLLYSDHYAAPHYYGAVRSRDLRTWEDCSPEMEFPAGQRHGTVLRITAAELARLRSLPRGE